LRILREGERKRSDILFQEGERQGRKKKQVVDYSDEEKKIALSAVNATQGKNAVHSASSKKKGEKEGRGKYRYLFR